MAHHVTRDLRLVHFACLVLIIVVAGRGDANLSVVRLRRRRLVNLIVTQVALVNHPAHLRTAYHDVADTGATESLAANALAVSTLRRGGYYQGQVLIIRILERLAEGVLPQEVVPFVKH